MNADLLAAYVLFSTVPVLCLTFAFMQYGQPKGKSRLYSLLLAALWFGPVIAKVWAAIVVWAIAG